MLKKREKNPCDTCKDVNTYNDYLRKKSNYTPLKDIVLYIESGVEREKLYLTCSSCEHNKEYKRIYKRRIKIKSKFEKLYDNLSETEPIIVNGFKETYRDIGLKIDFGSGWDYEMFKLYISEYRKANKNKIGGSNNGNKQKKTSL